MFQCIVREFARSKRSDINGKIKVGDKMDLKKSQPRNFKKQAIT